MENKEIIVQIANDERYYTKCYHDFMDCKLLNGEEKIIFLVLKRFLDIRSENGHVFPTIETIQEMTGWGNQKVVKYIKNLVEKGIVKKVRQGLNKPNIYILSDYPTMWECDDLEDMATIIENQGVKPLTPEEHIAELERMGYRVEIKEKGLESAPAKVQNQAHNNIHMDKDTTIEPESQVKAERYTMDQIEQLFDYEAMTNDNPYKKQDIDSVMDILHTTMNTTKPTIRIAKEDKPAMVVIGKLMKLDKDSIMYAIERFSEQTERITSPTAYMLTILYNAPEQFNLDIQNQVSHGMANWGMHNG